MIRNLKLLNIRSKSTWNWWALAVVGRHLTTLDQFSGRYCWPVSRAFIIWPSVVQWGWPLGCAHTFVRCSRLSGAEDNMEGVSRSLHHGQSVGTHPPGWTVMSAMSMVSDRTLHIIIGTVYPIDYTHMEIPPFRRSSCHFTRSCPFDSFRWSQRRYFHQNGNCMQHTVYHTSTLFNSPICGVCGKLFRWHRCVPCT